jgi:cytochrome c5
MRNALGWAVFATSLCGCSAAIDKPGAADLARAQAARPGNAQLAEHYERSCLACHGVAASGAPLTGFAPHWKPRLARGMDRMVEHVNNGLNAMPARGQCNDCSIDELRALTVFMSAAP